MQENAGGTDPKPTGAPQTDAPDDEELARRLRSLDARLGRNEETRLAAGRKRPANTGMAAALRLSTDFVAAVLVGAALGFGLDRLFGLAPWGMIVFLMLGFCAGVLNVLRSAGRMVDPHARGLHQQPKAGGDEDDDEDS